jgi:hypothetical protein
MEPMIPVGVPACDDQDLAVIDRDIGVGKIRPLFRQRPEPTPLDEVEQG